MKKFVKCLKEGEGIGHFIPGRVYEVTDEGYMTSENGHVYQSRGGDTNDAVGYLTTYWGYKFVPATAKDFLRNGDVVVDRQGYVSVYFNEFGTYGPMFKYLTGSFMPLGKFDENLRCVDDDGREYDITKVFRADVRGVNPWEFNSPGESKYWNKIWERKDVRKMTVAEICEALGYEVEVVK